MERRHLFAFVLECFNHRLRSASREKRTLSAEEGQAFLSFVERHRHEESEALRMWGEGPLSPFLDALLPDLRKR